MSSETPKHERNLRDVAVSRRGGVRSRGGRLPPINMREITQVVGTKKVVVPNIPQRRIKKEATQATSREPFQLKVEPGNDSSRQRRSRPAKVFLQTGGTFLAEGPAARIKKEPVGLDVSYSIPRVKVKGRESEIKYDPETIKDMLGSYDAESFYDDYFCDKPPHRLPLVKQKLFPKIKKEFDTEDDIKVKIKKEDSEDRESGDIKTDFMKPFKTTDYFRDIKDDDNKLILLKLPSGLSFMKQDVTVISDDKVEKISKEVESKMKETDTQNEGFIGKLRFMRSGRVILALGEIDLEVTDDKPLESYMEAATITLQQDMADLSILGTIDRRMIFSPTVDKLVDKDKHLSLSDGQ